MARPGAGGAGPDPRLLVRTAGCGEYWGPPQQHPSALDAAGGGGAGQEAGPAGCRGVAAPARQEATAAYWRAAMTVELLTWTVEPILSWRGLLQRPGVGAAVGAAGT